MNANESAKSYGVSVSQSTLEWAEANGGAEVVWLGEGEYVGWLAANGARAIATNADPLFEGYDGFDEEWAFKGKVVTLA